MRNHCSIPDCPKIVHGATLCAMHYQRLRHHGTTAEIYESSVARFWRQVDKNGPTPAHKPELGPCWLWTGSIGSTGYGRISVRRRGWVKAHRYAWEVGHGSEPGELHVLHRCDNPPCVNYERHLFLGAPLDNSIDKIAKGRHPQGPRVKNARFSAADIATIRDRLATGELQRIIAQDYRVDQRVISKIHRRAIYASV